MTRTWHVTDLSTTPASTTIGSRSTQNGRYVELDVTANKPVTAAIAVLEDRATNAAPSGTEAVQIALLGQVATATLTALRDTIVYNLVITWTLDTGASEDSVLVVECPE